MQEQDSQNLPTGASAVNEGVMARLLENLDVNICVSNLENDEIYFMNKKMRGDYGVGEDVVGQKCWQVMQTNMTGRCPFCPATVLEENPGEPIIWEHYNSKVRKHYKNTDSVIEWADGELVHLMHSVDITTEKNIQQSLLEVKHAADSASKAKSDFLSRMSHEIRTPLNAIIGMAKIALGVNELEKAKECLRKIDTSSAQLLGLINDILDMSKIEANKMEIVSEPFDFERMLIDISNIISVKSDEKQQKLHIHMDMNMPRFYNGDQMRISQVITNLLSNAVKFTPHNGTVRMDVWEKSNIGNTSVIGVSVSDTGIGIPKDQIPALFTAFEQADGGIARKFGGTGLGLAISKSIVNMMGGEISIESELDKGSTFSFSIKIERDPTATPPIKPLKGVDISGIRALLVDSSEETCEYFTQIMDSFGIKSDAVSTLDGCLAKLDESIKNNAPYQIVFVDWNIENTKGPPLCRMIKQRYGSCIIVLISVSQWSDIKEDAENCGVFKYLPKPLFPSILFDAINEAIGIPKKRVEPMQSTRYFFAGYRIIIAEDVEVNREVLSMALEDTKVKIDFVENGRVALEKFSADPNAYDLLLMDVNMPVMDGYDATRAIRALPFERAKKIPILAMTANAFTEDIQKSLECGMNDHLTKPVNFEQLFSKLQQYLIDYKMPPKTPVTTVATGSPPAAGQPRPQQAASSGDIPDIPGLDEYIAVSDALARVRGNRKIYKTLLQSFVKNSRIPELNEEIKSGDLDAAAKTAHSIKGASANLSLVAVNQSSMLLEAQLKTGTYSEEALQECNARFEKTKELIDELIEKM